MLEVRWVSAGIIIGLLYKNTKIFTTDPIRQWGAEINPAPHLQRKHLRGSSPSSGSFLSTLPLFL